MPQIQGGRLVRPDGAGGTPADIVAKLSDAVADAAQEPGGHRRPARAGHRAREQPAAGVCGLRPGAARAAPRARRRTSTSRSANSPAQHPASRQGGQTVKKTCSEDKPASQEAAMRTERPLRRHPLRGEGPGRLGHHQPAARAQRVPRADARRDDRRAEIDARGPLDRLRGRAPAPATSRSPPAATSTP